MFGDVRTHNRTYTNAFVYENINHIIDSTKDKKKNKYTQKRAKSRF